MKERIQGLDFLRGFAALGVVLFHLRVIFENFTPKTAFYDFLQNIPLPSLFLTISSFSLLYIYKDKFFNKENIKTFFLKRFFRLLPIYWFFLILAFISNHIFNIVLSKKLLTSSIFMFFSLIPEYERGYVSGSWFLGVDIIYLLIFPLLILFLNTKKKAWAALSITALFAVIFKNNSVLIQNFVYYVSGFVVYNHLEDILKLRTTKFCNHFFNFSLICCIGLFVINYYFMNNYFPQEITGTIIWMTLLASSLIHLPRLYNNKITNFLAKTSYSVYFMHQFLIILMWRLNAFNLLVDNYGVEKTMIIVPLFVISVSYGLSIFLRKYIEDPIYTAGKKWIENKKIKVIKREEEEVLITNSTV